MKTGLSKRPFLFLVSGIRGRENGRFACARVGRRGRGEGESGRAGMHASGRVRKQAGMRAHEQAGGRACEQAGGRACGHVSGRACERACERAGGRACERAGGRCVHVSGRACEQAGGLICGPVDQNTGAGAESCENPKTFFNWGFQPQTQKTKRPEFELLHNN